MITEESSFKRYFLSSALNSILFLKILIFSLLNTTGTGIVHFECYRYGIKKVIFLLSKCVKAKFKKIIFLFVSRKCLTKMTAREPNTGKQRR